MPVAQLQVVDDELVRRQVAGRHAPQRRLGHGDTLVVREVRVGGDRSDDAAADGMELVPLVHRRPLGAREHRPVALTGHLAEDAAESAQRRRQGAQPQRHERRAQAHGGPAAGDDIVRLRLVQPPALPRPAHLHPPHAVGGVPRVVPHGLELDARELPAQVVQDDGAGTFGGGHVGLGDVHQRGRGRGGADPFIRALDLPHEVSRHLGGAHDVAAPPIALGDEHPVGVLGRLQEAADLRPGDEDARPQGRLDLGLAALPLVGPHEGHQREGLLALLPAQPPLTDGHAGGGDDKVNLPGVCVHLAQLHVLRPDEGHVAGDPARHRLGLFFPVEEPQLRLHLQGRQLGAGVEADDEGAPVGRGHLPVVGDHDAHPRHRVVVLDGRRPCGADGRSQQDTAAQGHSHCGARSHPFHLSLSDRSAFAPAALMIRRAT